MTDKLIPFLFIGVLIGIVLLVMRLILVPDPPNEEGDESDLENIPEEKKGSENWKYMNLLVILLLSFILQFLFLYMDSLTGKSNMRFAIILDILILIRIGFARIINEKGKGWIFYAILAITSPILIDLLSYIRTGH